MLNTVRGKPRGMYPPVIQRGTVYTDLGSNYFDERKADAIQHRLIKRLERLGFKVTLEALPAAA